MHTQDERFHAVSFQPAGRWQDALPTGNGRMGALVYGHIRTERVLLNHEANWHRMGKPNLVDVSDRLPELRALLALGEYQRTDDFLQGAVAEAGGELARPDPYQPLCDLAISTRTGGAFTNYRRSVDFTTGEVTVAWTDVSVDFERSIFVSCVDDVIVMHIVGSEPGQLTCSFSLARHEEGIPPAPDVVPPGFSRWSEDGWLGIVGRYDDGSEFGATARVMVTGGQIETRGDQIHIREANSALLLIKLFADESAGIASQRRRTELEVLDADYDALLARHAARHGEIFLRMNLDLNGGPERSRSNEQLLLDAYSGEVSTALIERMFAYGRYLLICSSAPGSWPANLQGVWNGDYTPPWSSDYHNDENIQMNYWQALPGNMPEVTLPYFDYYERHLPEYRENARKLYGCRGIFVPIAQSVHGYPHPGVWLNWTAGAGWLAQLFYDYWLFTGDREFLERRAVPFLREVALFYEDFLFEGQDGRLVFSPSLSPENVPSIEGGSLTCVNATMDVAVAREVIGNLIQACELLGIEEENVARWRTILEKLPEYEINEDGAIREWLWPGLRDNHHHRHQSHIYPIFPGIEVIEESHPELFEACRIAVEKRLIIGLASQTGWSLAHMANIYARLGEGEWALGCLELLTRSCVGPNLFTYHNDWRGQGLTLGGGPGHRPPFQIDANFGLSAAILEMLVFSTPEMIKILPALPEEWSAGSVRGIACRGGVVADIEWNMDTGRLRVILQTRTDQERTLKFPEIPASIQSQAADEITESLPGPAYRVIHLRAARPTVLDVVFARATGDS